MAALAAATLLASGLGAEDEAAAAMARGEPMCEVTLELSDYETGESCWVDAPARGARAKATFPCKGGKTSFTFGRHAFKGRVKDDAIDARAKTTFEWQDGCTWQGDHAITGTIDSGALVYDYSEHVTKSDGSCESPCVARGKVTIVDD